MEEASMESRVTRLEEWKQNANADLYGSYGQPGLIKLMRDFFAVQAHYDKWLGLKIAGIAGLVPILYDIGKHLLGVK